MQELYDSAYQSSLQWVCRMEFAKYGGESVYLGH